MERYLWRGEPIEDVDAWAAGRGEPMIAYEASREVPSVVTGRLERETFRGRMPECFWSNLVWRGGWRYRRI